MEGRHDLRANHPSSSSLLVLAGSGAPGPSSLSFIGKRTYPSPLKGLSFCSVPYTPLGLAVLTVAGSLRCQPKLFMLSLNDDEAIVAVCRMLRETLMEGRSSLVGKGRYGWE